MKFSPAILENDAQINSVFLSQAADFSDCQSKNGKFYMYMDISASLWEQLVSGPKAGLPFRLRYCSHYEILLALIIYIKEEEN